jgi:Putative peptidoglycan binding domain/Lytic transglycolase
MNDSRPRRAAATDNRGRSGRPSSLAERPDRVALWAVALAVVALIAGAASAHAGSSGGISGGGTGSGGAVDSGTPGCPDREFGRRTLRVGDCGGDVETLNWILKSKDYRQAPLADDFKNPTAAAVRAFQRDAALGADGVVDDRTSAALVAGMPSELATWYGPGFFGNRTACRKTLTRRTVGVAHKTLPCGSKVVLRYKGRYVRTKVIDRGPFSNGAKWDLTQATAEALRLRYTDDVRVAKLAR